MYQLNEIYNNPQTFKILNVLYKIHVEHLNEEEDKSESNDFSIWTNEEANFLGQFDKFKDIQLGVIYSISDIGLREFLARSGKQLNCTAGTLFSLLKKQIIKIVPTGGYGNDTTYTLELLIPLTDIDGLAGKTQDDAGSGETGGVDTGGVDTGGVDTGAGAPVPPTEDEGGMEEPPDLEGPPVEWVVNYKDIITESTKIAKRLINERSSKKKL